MSDFDFEEYGEVTYNNKGWYAESFPTEGRKLLLLDADFIPYTVGFCAEKDTELSREEYLGHACYLIKDAMKKAEADCVRLFFTGANNFRDSVCPNYKGQRVAEKPPYFNEVREWLLGLNCSVVSDGCEADDFISITVHSYKGDAELIIGSKDKDLNQVVGWHVELHTGTHYYVEPFGALYPKYSTSHVITYEDQHLYEGKPKPASFFSRKKVEPDTYTRGVRKGERKTKRVATGKAPSKTIKKLSGTGLMFFYAQILMGDPVDNYHGVPKLGASKAYELLKNCRTEQELLRAAKLAYRSAFGRNWREEMTKMGRLAWMQQYEGQMWEIPDYDKEVVQERIGRVEEG